jgi:hypothetical protein
VNEIGCKKRPKGNSISVARRACHQSKGANAFASNVCYKNSRAYLAVLKLSLMKAFLSSHGRYHDSLVRQNCLTQRRLPCPWRASYLREISDRDRLVSTLVHVNAHMIAIHRLCQHVVSTRSETFFRFDRTFCTHEPRIGNRHFPSFNS